MKTSAILHIIVAGQPRQFQRARSDQADMQGWQVGMERRLVELANAGNMIELGPTVEIKEIESKAVEQKHKIRGDASSQQKTNGRQ